jgi:hypothetical protein
VSTNLTLAATDHQLLAAQTDHTTLPATEYFQMLLDGTPQVQPLQQADDCIPWPVFLDLLHCLCLKQGWLLEYGQKSDCSCAIFAPDEVSANQLSLFPDCHELYR